MNKRMLMALLALAMVTGMGSLAHAQSFGFSIGGGGYGHHHHHHCPPSYYFGFASPPPVYVYPRYVAPPPVTYVYPYAAAPAVAAPAPVAAAPAPSPAPQTAWKTRTEPRGNTLPVAQRQVTIIRNPAKSGGAVAFVVDEEDEVALNEGQSHSLLTSSNYTVEFDRGGDYGISRKTIGAGVHEFVVTERGWDLVNTKDRVLTATKPSIKSNTLPSTTKR